MSSSPHLSSLSPSKSINCANLNQVFSYFETLPDDRLKVKNSLLTTIDQISKGALQTSCAVEGGEYYRKSINNLALPVFENLDGAQYAIVKYRVRAPHIDEPPVKKDDGSFMFGSVKKIYVAVEVGHKDSPLVPVDLGKENALAEVNKLDEPKTLPKKEDTKLTRINEATTKCFAWGKARVNERLAISKKQKLLDEINLLRECQSEHVVELYGSCVFKGKDDIERVAMLMEFCFGDGVNVIDHEEFIEMTLAEQCQYVRKLLNMLMFLRDKQINHKDIKPENIFNSTSGQPKLGDFGLAIRFTEIGYHPISGSIFSIPSEEYLKYAADILFEKVQARGIAYNERLQHFEGMRLGKGDVFSMALYIYRLCINCAIMEDTDEIYTEKDYHTYMLNNSRAIEKYYLERLDFHFDLAFIELLRGMLDFNPHTRFDPEKCLEVLDAIEKKYLPDQRQSHTGVDSTPRRSRSHEILSATEASRTAQSLTV